MKKNISIYVGRRFFLNRKKDPSGVSGTGRVAWGVELPSKKVLIEWLNSECISETIYENLEQCMNIHSHEGNTVVEWIDNLGLTYEVNSYTRKH